MFAILLQDFKSTPVDGIAKRMMRTVNESMLINGHLIQVRADLGIAQRAMSEESGTVLMEHAISSLAEAKAVTDAHYAWLAHSTEHELEE